MSVSAREAKDRLRLIRNESIRAIVASEKAVERAVEASFQRARLRASLSVALLIVGFLLVAQWRGTASLASDLSRQTDQSLGIIIQQLTAENVALRDEVVRLQAQINEIEQDTRSRGEVLNQATRELNSLRVVSGFAPARGPGISVRIADPERVMLPQDFVAMVHELRAGGAEAISVNGTRLTATSGFAGGNGRVTLDGVELVRDYHIQAIGDPAALTQALELPGGLQSTLSTFPGVSVTVTPEDMVSVDAGQGRAFRYGDPAPTK